MSTTAPAKALIYKLDVNNRPTTRIEVMYNPKELAFNKSNNWSPKPSPKTDHPQLDFSGGGLATLKVQLVFDTYVPRETSKKKQESPIGAKFEDVREYTEKIYELTHVDPDLKASRKDRTGRPPYVRFQWAHTVFDGVITSIAQRFTLFIADTPVRAILDITFQQIREESYYAPQPPTNPTSGGPGGERVWVVKEGETLAWIAFEALGDAGQWRRIAGANGLDQVRNLRPGTRLMIPHD